MGFRFRFRHGLSVASSEPGSNPELTESLLPQVTDVIKLYLLVPRWVVVIGDCSGNSLVIKYGDTNKKA